MATTNVTITKTWAKVAEDTDDPFLIQAASSLDWEIAAVALDAAPVSTTGHRMTGDAESMTRSLIGAGFVYARIAPLSTASKALMIVSK